MDKEQNLVKDPKALRIGSVTPRFLFRYKCLDENFKVEIEAENLNKAMFKFATYYHQIQEIYSVVRVS